MSKVRRELREQQKLEKKAFNGGVPVSAATGSSSIKNIIPAFVAGVALGAGVLFAIGSGKQTAQPVVQPAAPATKTPETKLTIGNLSSIFDAELAGVDIARLNLLCAESLPGRSSLGIEESLRAVDQMAETARQNIARNHHRFVENPSEYENSEIFYRIGMMVTTLGKHLGVHYNPTKIVKPTLENKGDLSFFDKADDVFISGMMTTPREGTCSSMPVLYVAVGRRLGYPLKLVSAKGHLFFRWEDGKDKMNFECTNRVAVYDDNHYKNWPYPIKDDEIKMGWYLRSLTPREEAAIFLSIRACTLLYHGRTTEALLAQTQASLLQPSHPEMNATLGLIAEQELASIHGTNYVHAKESEQSDPFQILQEVEAMNNMNRRTSSPYQPFPNIPNVNIPSPFPNIPQPFRR